MPVKLICSLALCLFVAAGTARADCNASAVAQWNAYQVQAFSIGKTCPKALVVLAIRDKAGDVAWSWSAGAQDNFDFTEATAKPGMLKALQGWASGKGFARSADALVTTGEFPFVPDEALADGEFSAMQMEKAPVFCFVTGMESGRCLARRKTGEIIEIGVQRFPG